MTYRELILQAEFKLDHNDITLGEFEQMIAPLNREVDVLDKIIAEIEQIEINGYIRDVECFTAGINTALNVINKYRNEVIE